METVAVTALTESGPLRRLGLVLLVGMAARALFIPLLGSRLPLDGLYVDERIYAAGLDGLSEAPFPRPPGMYAVMHVFRLFSMGPVAGRISGSMAGIVPAALIAVSLPGSWGLIAGLLCSLDPYLILAGAQLLPGVWAAALVAIALHLALRRGFGRHLGMMAAGLLYGCASLFRGELLLLVPLLPLARSMRWKPAVRMASGVAVIMAPVLLWNLSGGAPSVPAANGGLNAWLGTGSELVEVPPGVEFEELVAVPEAAGPLEASVRVTGSLDRYFWARAVASVRSDVPAWLTQLPGKALGAFALPGPGRNMDVAALMRGSGLIVMLPVALAGLALAIAGLWNWRCAADRGRVSPGGGWIGLFLLVQLLIALLFFPASRFRVSCIPGIWFLVGTGPFPSGGTTRERLRVGGVAVAILLVSLVLFPLSGWRGTRPGLNAILRAEYLINRPTPETAEVLAELEEAELAGFRGADLHNLRGIALARSGELEEALAEFERAVSMAPRSPTAWSNLAAALWESGRRDEARGALERASGLGGVPERVAE